MSAKGKARKDALRVRRSKRQAEASEKVDESAKKQKKAAQQAEHEHEHEVMETISLNGNSPDNSDVWIIGDSIVKHGGDYAMKLGCEQLGQTRHRIVWLGKSSMRWEQLLPSLQLQMITRGHPRMIIIHLGGNNVDSVPQLTLMEAIRDDLKYIHSVFQSSSLIWCDILPRLFW